MPDTDNDVAQRLREAAQDDLPVVTDPFRTLADRHGLTEPELLEALREWVRAGVVRRYGALVNHRKLGFAYNAMVVWEAPAERVEEVGRVFADDPEVTHCYERPPAPGFPYNLYTMIHTATEQECSRKVRHLSELSGIARYEVLLSTREFKKSSPRYGAVLGLRPVPNEEGAADE